MKRSDTTLGAGTKIAADAYNVVMYSEAVTLRSSNAGRTWNSMDPLIDRVAAVVYRHTTRNLFIFGSSRENGIPSITSSDDQGESFTIVPINIGARLEGDPLGLAVSERSVVGWCSGPYLVTSDPTYNLLGPLPEEVGDPIDADVVFDTVFIAGTYRAGHFTRNCLYDRCDLAPYLPGGEPIQFVVSIDLTNAQGQRASRYLVGSPAGVYELVNGAWIEIPGLPRVDGRSAPVYDMARYANIAYVVAGTADGGCNVFRLDGARLTPVANPGFSPGFVPTRNMLAPTLFDVYVHLHYPDGDSRSGLYSAVSVVGGIAELPNEEQHLRAYPNPARSTVTLRVPAGSLGRVHITDLLGKHIRTIETTSERVVVDTEDIPAGMYLVHSSGGSVILFIQ